MATSLEQDEVLDQGSDDTFSHNPCFIAGLPNPESTWECEGKKEIKRNNNEIIYKGHFCKIGIYFAM
jgi:hypothetical protein